MKIKVYLLKTNGVSNTLVQKVLALLTIPGSVFNFLIVDIPQDFADDILSWDSIFSKCSDFRLGQILTDEDFVILLTEKRNVKNWFSTCDPEGPRSIFIHTSGWEYYAPGASEFSVAYQVVNNILQRLMFQDFEQLMNNYHNEPRGCTNDLCQYKPDITLKLRTADICPDCLEILKVKKIPLQVIEQSLAIFEKVRIGVLYSNQFRNILNSDLNLPFPVAITLRKLKNTQEPLKKFLFLLDHFDSIVRIFILLAGPETLGNGFQQFYKNNELGLRPSLGHWVKALQAYSKELKNIGIDLKKESLDGIRMVTEFCERDHIVNLRNDRRGHGYINPNDNQYTEDFEKYRPIVQEIEKLFTPFFTKFRLLQVLNSAKVDNKSFKITVFNLMGSHPDFSQEEINVEPETLNEVPIVNQVYLNSLNGKQWTQISPYILYDNCSECKHPRMLVADGEVYIDPYIGHRVKVS
jgi:hypothetical protein